MHYRVCFLYINYNFSLSNASDDKSFTYYKSKSRFNHHVKNPHK